MKFGTMEVDQVEGFPPKSNPFHHDAINMGTPIASNVMVMHHTHHFEKADYLYVVNTDTGERIRVRFTR